MGPSASVGVKCFVTAHFRGGSLVFVSRISSSWGTPLTVIPVLLLFLPIRGRLQASPLRLLPTQRRVLVPITTHAGAIRRPMSTHLDLQTKLLEGMHRSGGAVSPLNRSAQLHGRLRPVDDGRRRSTILPSPPHPRAQFVRSSPSGPEWWPIPRAPGLGVYSTTTVSEYILVSTRYCR